MVGNLLFSFVPAFDGSIGTNPKPCMPMGFIGVITIILSGIYGVEVLGTSVVAVKTSGYV